LTVDEGIIFFDKKNDIKSKLQSVSKTDCNFDLISFFLSKKIIPSSTVKSRTSAIEYPSMVDLTVDEGIIFFDKKNDIKSKLQSVSKTGLNYMSLGQPLSTLSGGETVKSRTSAIEYPSMVASNTSCL
jgi:hypothetical protein